MPRTVAVCLLLLLAACRGPREYAAPAPAGALDCALRQARDMGYNRMEGANAPDYVRVSQRVDLANDALPQTGDPRTGPDVVRPRASDEPRYNELIMREDGGRLRIQIVPPPPGARTEEVGRTADGDAQRILAACTTE